MYLIYIVWSDKSIVFFTYKVSKITYKYGFHLTHHKSTFQHLTYIINVQNIFNRFYLSLNHQRKKGVISVHLCTLLPHDCDKSLIVLPSYYFYKFWNSKICNFLVKVSFRKKKLDLIISHYCENNSHMHLLMGKVGYNMWTLFYMYKEKVICFLILADYKSMVSLVVLKED